MPVKDVREEVKKEPTDTVSREEYEKVLAELKRYQEAFGKLLNAMGQRYVADLAREVLGE